MLRSLFNFRNARRFAPLIPRFFSGFGGRNIPLFRSSMFPRSFTSSSILDYPTQFQGPKQQKRYFSTTSPPPSSSRVDAPVKGLYDSIKTDAPDALDALDTPIREKDGKKSLTTVYGNDGDLLQRSYDPKNKQLILNNAFLRNTDRWVDTPVPMVKGKGTPTQVAETLRQMKLLGIDYGSLNSAKMSTIQNMETIMQLHSMMSQGKSAEEALPLTHSVQYAGTTLTQSGHQMTSASLNKKGAWTSPIGDLMKHYEKSDPNLKDYHDKLLTKYGFDRGTKMLQNFDIELGLKPHDKE